MNSLLGESEPSESGNSAPSEAKNNIIDKILGEMKSQFNSLEIKKPPATDPVALKIEAKEEPAEESSAMATAEENESSLEGANNSNNTQGEVELKESSRESSTKTEEESTNGNNTEEEGKPPRIVLLFKKPTTDSSTKSIKSESSPGRRTSLRHKSQPEPDKSEDSGPKRSSRRRSKDCESVLQSAIARKEKSYNEANKPQRLTRQLKPTQKILENLALAKQEKTKLERGRSRDDDKDEERPHKRHKHKHHHGKHSRKSSKRLKSGHNNYPGSERESEESEQSEDSCSKSLLLKNDEGGFRRSRRISSSRFKEDSNTDLEEPLPLVEDNPAVYTVKEVEAVEDDDGNSVKRLCLCAQTTQYYLAPNDDEETFCTAVDTYDDKVIGCNRIVDHAKDVMMIRPSPRIPYSVFCDAHKNRMLRHNCCPGCGVFCSQGRFVECENKHQYHRNCQVFVDNIESCPHCGLPSPEYDVHITMHTSKKPVLLPMQRVQYVSAKMTFRPNSESDEEHKCVTPPLLSIKALELLSSTNCRNDGEHDISELISAIKNDTLSKVAKILGSKSIDLSSKIPEINEGTLLHLAAQSGQVSTVHMLLVAGLQLDIFDRDQNTPLMLAVLTDKTEVVRYLIRTGASITLKGTDGMTALHLAAKCGNFKACQLLLKSTSSIKNYINLADDGGWTPLVWACEHGYADVATFLINKGADPSIRDVEYNVALHWAAFSGSSHIAELLLNRGCEINAVNAHGDTPLHIGARQDRYNAVLVLLARGADVTLLNKNNESPLDCVPPDGDCYHPISLNIGLQATADFDCPNIILTNDISKGKETNPIQCFNNVDNEPKPGDFIYVTKNCITSDDVRIDVKITSMQSCTCQERCVEDDCLCGKLSVKCWYDDEGKLTQDFNFGDMPMIFECNDGCACNTITCNNRVVQKGLTQRFEVFKTADKGWGVRSLRPIPRGTFVCEYVGEIITDVDADKRDDDNFLFDLENRVCRSVNEDDTYCIDAKFYGNFSRFINHACSPNLTSVKVFTDHQDLRFPRIAFFANKDIAIEEELSFDYGEKFWMAKYKSFYCSCGGMECKYSEDAIEETIQTYQRRLLEESG